VTDEWATEVLRQTPGVVRLTVLRDDALVSGLADDKDLYEVFTLDLVKKPGKGLGFSIVQRRHDNGIYVSDVVSCAQFTVPSPTRRDATKRFCRVGSGGVNTNSAVGRSRVQLAAAVKHCHCRMTSCGPLR